MDLPGQESRQPEEEVGRRARPSRGRLALERDQAREQRPLGVEQLDGAGEGLPAKNGRPATRSSFWMSWRYSATRNATVGEGEEKFCGRWSMWVARSGTTRWKSPLEVAADVADVQGRRTRRTDREGRSAPSRESTWRSSRGRNPAAHPPEDRAPPPCRATGKRPSEWTSSWGVDGEAAHRLPAGGPPGPHGREGRVGEDLLAQFHDLLDATRLRELPEIWRDLDRGEQPVRRLGDRGAGLEELGHGLGTSEPGGAASGA